ncbi:hypothetical protein LX73_1382 [Fodinibius salinus]|uniref:DoxX family protein n=1 Tax=Fodinibius salinus TaxID=860790 RepID=A0A5D3YIR5_9BACT|nr:DoxX family protein [Fodinibius salinus]TYP93673.1 hypothetical protein LX73_1382 [Fodinibius salinus]
MLSTIGRYMYALPFGVFGLFHFINGSQMAGMVPIPGGIFWIYLTGVAMLAACVSIIIETKARLACILLGVLLLIYVLSIHLPSVINGQMQPSMTMLLKDLVMAGGAWFIAGSYEAEDMIIQPEE